MTSQHFATEQGWENWEDWGENSATNNNNNNNSKPQVQQVQSASVSCIIRLTFQLLNFCMSLVVASATT